ncbi:MAG: TetR/AcrR family transcriptional regulator [Candidatus Dormibacteraceae bacterium]
MGYDGASLSMSTRTRRSVTVDTDPIQSIPPVTAAKGPLLPPRATANGTLRRLQEAALIGFCERGYHGLSTRDLATATGVRASSVYAHVNAKEDLLFQLVTMGHEEHNELLRKALMGSGPDPRDQMKALVRAHVVMHATYPLLARVCNKELHALSPSNADRVMRVRLDSEQMFLDVVKRGIETGTFHIPDPWLAVAAIAAMGLRVAEWFEPGGPRSVDEVADHYSEFALKLLS